MSQNQFDQSNNNNKVEGSSRLEIQKRLQERLKTRTDTTSRSTPRTFQQLPDYLKQVLPDNYTYIIKSYKEIELETFAGAPTAAFDSTFYINISSIEAIEQWKAAFHAKTGTIFRITRADKVKGIKVIYHKDFHCRHADIAAIKYMQKTYAQKVGQRRNRNTNCQCLAKIRLEKSRLQLSHPCEVHLAYKHNHPLEILDNINNLTNSIIVNNNIHNHNNSNINNNIYNNNIEESGGDIDLNSTNNIMLTNIPNTPSNASTSSDESGSNTPQCNLEFEFESSIEPDLSKGDTDYCNELFKFIDDYGRERIPNNSNASIFFNQFIWPETATNNYNNYNYNSFIESDDELQNLTIDNNEGDDNIVINHNINNNTFTPSFLDYYTTNSTSNTNNTNASFYNNQSTGSSSIRQTALKRSASEYFPDQHQLHGSSSLKRRSTTTGAGRTNYNNN